MKKYLIILKTEFMIEISYTINILTGFIGCFLHLFIFLNLWKYIYSDPSQLINGYSMNQMIWYVIITEIIWSVSASRKLCKKIVNDVKNGNIVYNINKPYSYVGYILSSHLGSAILSLIIFLILGMLTGIIFLHELPNLNIIQFIFVIIAIILAIIINSIIVILIGLISFKMEDSTPIYWIYSKIILIIGTIFPVEYFPSYLQGIITYSPIYVVSYGPAKLFVDFSILNAIKIFAFQFGYLIISYLLCNLLYRKEVRNLNVNGG